MIQTIFLNARCNKDQISFVISSSIHIGDLTKIRSYEIITLEFGINVPPGINVAPGQFGKKNKRNFRIGC